jgi:hypothetical protein
MKKAILLSGRKAPLRNEPPSAVRAVAIFRPNKSTYAIALVCFRKKAGFSRKWLITQSG